MTSLWDRIQLAGAAEWERQTLPPPGPVQWAAQHGLATWSKQRDILASLEASKHTVVQSAHGVGKTWTAAMAAAWWIDTHPPGDTMIVSTAPSYEQVHAILWEEIRKFHGALSLPGRVLGSDHWVVGDRLVGMGRKPPDNRDDMFQGIHRKYVLVILDEACGIPRPLWTAAEAITTGPHCRILAIGNPDDPDSHFAKICDPQSRSWARHKISAYDSPNFTPEEVPAELADALVTPEWAAERMEEWGEDSPLFIAKVLGEFPRDAPWQIVPVSDLLGCRLELPRAAHELLPVELGCDIGGGTDETVVRERRGMVAGRQWAERSRNPESISRLIVHAIRETGATAVKVDSIGVGFNVVGELRNLAARGDHQARIHGVNVAQAATDPAKFSNLKAQIWWQIGRVGSQRREWDLSRMDDADKTVAQLLTPRYKLDVRGRIQCESKDDIRARTGRSPDQADALLLAFCSPHSGAAAVLDAMAAGRFRPHAAA